MLRDNLMIIDVAALLKILLIFILALISPGPDFMIVSSTSLARGRLEGIKAAAGVGTIIWIYTLVSLMGLSAMFEHYAWLVLAIKIGGGLYLLYLGAILLKGSFVKKHCAAQIPESKSHKSSYLTGAFACLTNPKAIAFFASIFALALTPNTTLSTKVAIGFTIPMITFFWFSIVAIGLSTPAIRTRYNKWRHIIDRATGLVLVSVGAKLLISSHD